MDLNDLSAQELAKIDNICLAFESSLRSGKAIAIDDVVAKVNGKYSDLLRRELAAVQHEVNQELNAESIHAPFQDHGDANLAGSVHGAVTAGFFGASDARQMRKSDSDKSMLPSPGHRLGPYVIVEKIGRGGMGTVFRATDTRLDRQVAVKVLSLGGSRGQELNDRFEREAKAVAALSHPNIVELFDVGAVEGKPFAVMELLRGETLAERAKLQRFSPLEVRDIGAQIADALAFAHEAGVIHRDLKPQNVMILGSRASKTESDSNISRFEIATKEAARRSGSRSSSKSGSRPGSKSGSRPSSKPGSRPGSKPGSRPGSKSGSGKLSKNRIKVLDFGLSRIVSDRINTPVSDTKHGEVLGSPGYMAPEQARGEPVTSRADLFSLGCVLFELFYGDEAIPGETPADRLAATLRSIPKGDDARRRDDVALAQLIDQCLSSDPAERPESANAVVEALREPIHNTSPHLTSLGEGYSTGEVLRRRFLATIGGGAVGGLAAVVAGGVFDRPRAVRSIAVLSFDNSPPDEPIGDRKPTEGERISALLVHELSRLDNEIAIPPFTHLRANSPADFKRLGEELNVDALVTGTARHSGVGNSKFLELDLKLVWAETGKVLWSAGVQRVGDNLLEQGNLAAEIAAKIDRRLTTTADEVSPPTVEQYKCLVDGKVMSNPDSVDAMRMALDCLEMASHKDPTYVEPRAGLALTGMMLAAQSDDNERVTISRDAFNKALELAPKSVSANLAKAMYEWQIQFRYSNAENVFDELVNMHPYNWQVKHQFGLLKLATGQFDRASAALRDASRLNPLSTLVRIDTARAEFYNRHFDRALTSATSGSWKSHPFAIGLAIDVHEQQGRWTEAANMDAGFTVVGQLSKEEYARERQRRLHGVSDDQLGVPYGPFGKIMNQAIFDARFTTFDDAALRKLVGPPSPPMLPLLLAAHPAFDLVRQLDLVREFKLLPDYEDLS